MDIFAIHLLPEDNVAWAIRVPNGERTTLVNYRASRAEHMEPHVEEIIGDPERKSMWYAENEVAANALAELIATNCPNREVHVYKLQSVTRAPAAKPVRAVLTEKGLVPE